MSYALLADLKAAIRITDTDSDVLLQVGLDAASEAINEHCNRTFIADTVVTTRYFEPSNGKVTTDDFYTTTGLIVSTGGTAIPAGVHDVSSGYFLTPENGPPYTGFVYTAYGLYSWPLFGQISRATVSVTAKWGYSLVVPPAVKLACLLQASRWFARRNSPYGIAGSPEMGSELRLLAKLDADVAVMLAGKVRY